MNAVPSPRLQLVSGLVVLVAVTPCAGAAPPGAAAPVAIEAARPAPTERPATAVAAVVSGGPAASGAGGEESRCEVAFGQDICFATYDPTSLDARIEAVSTSAPGAGGHPGRHYACYPAQASRWNGQLLVHLVGTWGDPAESHAFVELACSLGYAAVAPMYKNVQDARPVCGADAECYEGMRREVLYGGDTAPAPIAVDAANSILHRVDTLLARLAERETRFAPWRTLRGQVVARDFSAVALSGHSQGAGHALLWARDHEVAKVIMLGGLTDRLRSGTAEHSPVPWVAAWAGIAKTSADRLWAYNHGDDKIVVPSQLSANFDALTVGAMCPFSEAGEYPLSCRRIRAPQSGCPPLEAHLLVVHHRFGAAAAPCQLGGTESSNAATWQFLLLAP